MNTDLAGEVDFPFSQRQSPNSETFFKALRGVIPFILICVHLWFH
jgi:hypothetical protein